MLEISFLLTSRHIRSYLVLAFILYGLLFSLGTPAAGADADDFWKFYEKHPHMQDYFPFGVYGAEHGNWTPMGHSPKAYSRILTDLIAENGFNVIWGGRTPAVTREEKGGPLVSTPFSRWFYGQELPVKDMKTFPTLINFMRFNAGALAKFQRESPPLNEEEMAEVEEDRKDYLEFAASLAKEYPESIIGFISDDEPHLVAPAIASIRLLEKYTNLPVTTCLPSWGAFTRFVGHMQPVTADWYPTHNAKRDSWEVARNLRWLQRNHPDRVFYFIPLAAAYSHEPTKPGLKDIRPSRTELRMQFWQALAWGTKGFFYYHVGGHVTPPQWAGGQDGLLNDLLWPHHELWDELGDISRFATTIGPLLIPCRPDVSIPFEVLSGQVRYPEFEGPAIDYGLLKSVKNNRYFLIPWNNNINGEVSGRIIFPEEILTGRKVYDLVNLREAELVNVEGKQGMELALPAGGGQIFLIASAEEFELCRRTILRHRVRHPRIVAQMRYRIAKTNGLQLKRPEDVDAVLEEAKGAEAERNWVKAAELYQKVTSAIRKNEDSYYGKWSPQIHETRTHLNRTAEILSQTEDLFRTHKRVFDLSGSTQLYAVHGTNKYVGKELLEWAGLANMYLDALIRSREGTYRAARPTAFLNTVLTLEGLAEKNKQAVEAVIEKRLDIIRQPIKLALITPDRNELEYHTIRSWAYENTSSTWIAPDETGKLTDENGTSVRLSDYDAIWIHQLRYAQPPVEGESVDPMKALMPELLNEQTVQTMKEYVENGGSLVLTGISGLYAVVLGVEKTVPDRIRENSYLRTPTMQEATLAAGFVAADGFENHPIFKDFPAEGFITTTNFPGNNLLTECAWKNRVPSGKVIGNELLEDKASGEPPTGPPGRITRYAAIVEYPSGKGKIMVIGGRACDFTSIRGTPGEHSKAVLGIPGLRKRIRKLVLNALVYCTGLP